jgi:hypothetical protein
MRSILSYYIKVCKSLIRRWPADRQHGSGRYLCLTDRASVGTFQCDFSLTYTDDLTACATELAEIKGQEHVKLSPEESWLQWTQKSVLPIAMIPPKNPAQVEFAG